MSNEPEFNQTRSFNLGIAQETSIEAALVYDEISFWSTKSTTGWVYKSYEDMKLRLPLSKYQLREAYKKLQEKGYIEIKLKKAMGAPTLHFRLLKNLTIHSKKTSQSIVKKLDYPMDSKKTSQSITATTPIKHQAKAALANKLPAAVDHRGVDSPAKERLRMALKKGELKSLRS